MLYNFVLGLFFLNCIVVISLYVKKKKKKNEMSWIIKWSYLRKKKKRFKVKNE